jgi:hypothetical protein
MHSGKPPPSATLGEEGSGKSLTRKPPSPIPENHTLGEDVTRGVKALGEEFLFFFLKKSQNPALWPPPAGRPALWPTPAAAPGRGSGCRRRGANGGGRFRGGSEGGRRHARSGGGRHCAWSKSPTSRREWRPPSRREWRSPGRLEVAGESGGRRRGGRELRSLGRGEWRSPRI